MPINQSKFSYCFQTPFAISLILHAFSSIFWSNRTNFHLLSYHYSLIRFLCRDTHQCWRHKKLRMDALDETKVNALLFFSILVQILNSFLFASNTFKDENSGCWSSNLWLQERARMVKYLIASLECMPSVSMMYKKASLVILVAGSLLKTMVWTFCNSHWLLGCCLFLS